jgi:F-type H+-transporting ATPase subunit delta
MTSPAVASRYASALVDVVLNPKSQTQPGQIAGELRDFEALLESSPELRNALAAPSVPTARKKAILGRIADRLALGRITRNFLFVLNSHRRMDALAAVIDTFEVLLDERLGFSRAHVTSAQELDAAQRAQLEAELARLTGRRMRLKFATDESLIGGVIARIGSTVYDGSVKGRLEVLARQLSGE